MAAIVSIAGADSDNAEGDSGTTAFTFTATRTGDLSGTSSIKWTVSGVGDHPALAADFLNDKYPTGTVSFAAGEASKLITVKVEGDHGVEADNAFKVTLSGASSGTTIGTASATGIIRNDDFTTTLSITASDADRAEGDMASTPLSFTVTRSGDISAADSAHWTVTGNGGAPAGGSDFAGGALPGGTVSFAAGESSKTVTVAVAGDTRFEADETFDFTLSAPSAGVGFGAVSATGTIRNDDSPPSLAIAALDADKAEGNAGTTAFTFTVTRSGDLSGDSLAHWDVAGTGAAPASAADFAGGAPPSGTVSFAAGESSKTITIDVAGTTTIEADESFGITLSAPSSGTGITTAGATGTIRNDDVPPSLAIVATDADKAEGGAGDLTPFTFTVTRSGDVSAASSAKWTVAGTGTNPANAADFPGDKLPSGTVNFAAGESSKLITINVEGDKGVEPDNGFKVTLSGVSAGTTIATAGATGVIRNDDSLTTLAIAATDADKAEGNSGSTAFTFTVTRSGDVAGASSAQWAVIGSGANPAGSADFVGGIKPSGTVSFAAGEASKLITVNVAGNTAVEADNGFQVTLSTPVGATLATASAAGLIRNDDVPASYSIGSTQIDNPEGFGGATPFFFTIVRNGDRSEAASVSYKLIGTGEHGATANDFYDGTLPGGIVYFPAGVVSQRVEFFVAGDTSSESDETFQVNLTAPSPGTSITTGSANGTIRNDDVLIPDTLVTISSPGAYHQEGSSGAATAFVFNLVRSGDVSGTSSATWSVEGNGASPAEGSDFLGGQLPSGTISFAPGETSKAITVFVTGDTLLEKDEGITLKLTSLTAGTGINAANANGIIYNDDAPHISVVAIDADKAEGNSGTTPFTFLVTRDGDLSASLAATWTRTGTSEDFTSATSGDFTFGAGETSKTITVDVKGDTVFEADETFNLTISPGGSGLTVPGAIGTIRNDDAKPPAPAFAIAPTDADHLEGNLGSTPFTFAITRSADLSSTDSVSWLVNGMDPIDFTGGTRPSGSVTFAPGETSKLITVNIAGDKTIESDEGFAVYITPPMGVTSLVASAAGLVRNDDLLPPSLAIVAKDAYKYEGSSGSTAFTFTVGRYSDVSGTSTVKWAVSGVGNDAAASADFGSGVKPSGTLSFAPGEISKTITVNVAGDTAVEADNVFAVTLSSPSSGTSIATSVAYGTIRNDDFASPVLSIAAASNPTGEVGTAGFTVTRTGGLSGTSTAHWMVSGWGDHPASADDFAGSLLPSGTVSFAAGQATQYIYVPIAQDSVIESDESLTITLSSPSPGTTIGSSSASAIIPNDDFQFLLAIASLDANKEGGNPGSTPYTFNVTRSGDLSIAASANWTVQTNSATVNDFVGGALPAGTVSFAAGESTKTITIGVSADLNYENNEGFSVLLSAPSPGGAITRNRADGVIINDDPGISTISASGSAPETEGQVFWFLVSRAGQTAFPEQIYWAVAGTGAHPVDADDFAGQVLPSGIISFANGETFKLVELTGARDTSNEFDEDFIFSLTRSPGGTSIATESGRVINDPDGIAIIAGGPGADTLLAGSGRAFLTGGDGGDRLVAGIGDMHLTKMTGGLGADIFAFSSTGAATITSLTGLPAYQEITDFAPGIDHIDLSFAVGPNDVLTTDGSIFFTQASAARIYAQQLLDSHVGVTDIAALRVGPDIYLFYNGSGTGAAIDSAIKLDGLAATLSPASFI